MGRMQIDDDKRLHLQAGALLALLLVAVALLTLHASPGLAVAAGSVAMGWGVERYQAVRRDGEASYADMTASAAPGVLAGLLFEAWQVFGGGA